MTVFLSLAMISGIVRTKRHYLMQSLSVLLGIRESMVLFLMQVLWILSAASGTIHLWNRGRGISMSTFSPLSQPLRPHYPICVKAPLAVGLYLSVLALL